MNFKVLLHKVENDFSKWPMKKLLKKSTTYKRKLKNFTIDCNFYKNDQLNEVHGNSFKSQNINF